MGDDAVILENKMEVGIYFADKGLNDYQLSRDVMAVVTADDATVVQAKGMIDGGAINSNVAFKKNVKVIDKALSKNILGYDYDSSIKNNDNLSVITLSSDLAKTLKVGEIITIPMRENKAFPIGKSGRVEAVDIND